MNLQRWISTEDGMELDAVGEWIRAESVRDLQEQLEVAYRLLREARDSFEGVDFLWELEVDRLTSNTGIGPKP